MSTITLIINSIYTETATIFSMTVGRGIFYSLGAICNVFTRKVGMNDSWSALLWTSRVYGLLTTLVYNWIWQPNKWQHNYVRRNSTLDVSSLESLVIYCTIVEYSHNENRPLWNLQNKHTRYLVNKGPLRDPTVVNLVNTRKKQI